MIDEAGGMLDEKVLLDLVIMQMPFGKYKGRLLIDLPESYVVWFNQERISIGKIG